jgi:hypothetical protein
VTTPLSSTPLTSTWNPIQLAPAAGWRAVYYVYDDDPDVPLSWESCPLVAWALCASVRWHPGTGRALPPDRDSPEKNAVHGVIVIEGQWVDVVTMAAGFWRYLAPGEADPTPEEFAAEQARLLRHAAK